MNKADVLCRVDNIGHSIGLIWYMYLGVYTYHSQTSLFLRFVSMWMTNKSKIYNKRSTIIIYC